MTLRNLNFCWTKAKNNMIKWRNPDRNSLKFKTSNNIQSPFYPTLITHILATKVKLISLWRVLPQAMRNLPKTSIPKQIQNWTKLIRRLKHRKFHKLKFLGWQSQLASQLTLPHRSKGHIQVGKCEKMNKDEVSRAYLQNSLLILILNLIRTIMKKMLIRSTWILRNLSTYKMLWKVPEKKLPIW